MEKGETIAKKIVSPHWPQVGQWLTVVERGGRRCMHVIHIPTASHDGSLQCLPQFHAYKREILPKPKCNAVFALFDAWCHWLASFPFTELRSTRAVSAISCSTSYRSNKSSMYAVRISRRSLGTQAEKDQLDSPDTFLSQKDQLGCSSLYLLLLKLSIKIYIWSL